MENKEHKFELDEKELQEFNDRLKESRFNLLDSEKMQEVLIFDYKDYLKSKKARLSLTITDTGKTLLYKKEGEESGKLNYLVKVDGPVEDVIKEMGYNLSSSYQKKEAVWESEKDKIVVETFPFTSIVKVKTENLKKLAEELKLEIKKEISLEVDDIFNDRFGYEKHLRF